MRRLTVGALFCALSICPGAAGDGPRPVIRLVEFADPITPISALRITKAIDEAEERGDAFVLIELDTPGGLVNSMETLVKRMLASEVPIVVWVGPAGAKAASAGFFLLIAADVAAMAPGTRTGAASGVYGYGESREGDIMLKKVNEDLAALIRSIATRRNRNVEACEKAVFAAKAYEEQVALDEGLVDLIAASREELLERLDGYEVRRFDGSTTVLRAGDPQFAVTEFSIRHQFMEVLAIPAVAAFLLLAGLGGLYVEFTHPGVVFPGVVGALCLLLFALSAQVLPVSTVGVLLIVLALIMFLLEIKVTSFGMLTLGGAIALIIGGWMLVDGPIPELRVPLAFVVPLAVAVTLVCAFVVRLAVRALRSRVGTGKEGMTGQVGVVREALASEAKVFVHGELWDAVSTAGTLTPGMRVRVLSVQDMRLSVEPADRGEADDVRSPATSS